MDNLGASQNGQPGATNAGQGQGTTGTTTLGNSAIGAVVGNTGYGAGRRRRFARVASSLLRSTLPAQQRLREPTQWRQRRLHGHILVLAWPLAELMGAVMGNPGGAGAATGQPATQTRAHFTLPVVRGIPTYVTCG